MKGRNDVSGSNRCVRLAPCVHCPFTRRGRDWLDLRPGRTAEIAGAIVDGAPFLCHETTTLAEDDAHSFSLLFKKLNGDEIRVDVHRERACAGALGSLLISGGVPGGYWAVVAGSMTRGQRARLTAHAGLMDLEEFVGGT